MSEGRALGQPDRKASLIVNVVDIAAAKDAADTAKS